MKTKEAEPITKQTDEKSRREFLVKAGKMALYIPPAMMVLMHPSRNALSCGSVIIKKSNRHHHHHDNGAWTQGYGNWPRRRN